MSWTRRVHRGRWRRRGERRLHGGIFDDLGLYASPTRLRVPILLAPELDVEDFFGGGGALPLSVPVPPLRIPRSPRCAAPSLISSNVCTCLTADANPAASIRLRTISRSPEFHSRSVPICPIAASMSRNAQLTSAVFRVAVPESHPELSLPCRDENRDATRGSLAARSVPEQRRPHLSDEEAECLIPEASTTCQCWLVESLRTKKTYCVAHKKTCEILNCPTATGDEPTPDLHRNPFSNFPLMP